MYLELSKVAKFQDRNITDRTRHLSFDHQLNYSWEIPSSMFAAKHLRTFLLPEQFKDGSYFNSAVLQQLISNFRCLRILDLRNLGMRTLPKSIGKLLHLRYLNLSENPIKKLPNSIIKLQNLQTLILVSCPRLTALPKRIRKLRNLRSLDILDCRRLSHIPPGLGELISLHKLPDFMVGCRISPKFQWSPATAQLRDLKALNNLSGSLEIKLHAELADPASEAKEANLIAKHGLTNLFIDLSQIKHDEAVLEVLKPPQNLKKLEIFTYGGKEFPSWAMGDSLCMTLPNLVEIRLIGFHKCRQGPCLSQLPFLKRLTLDHLTRVEYMENSVHEVESPLPSSTRTFFPSLQELVLNDMDNLKGWWEETKVVDCSDEENLSQPSTQCHPVLPSFSCLTKLQISDCPDLVSFPVSPNVEVLLLEKVNKKLTVLKKVRNSEGGADVGSSKLKRLTIDDVQVLISMPVDCLAQLTLLEFGGSELKNTSQLKEVFKYLSSLTSLTFDHCWNLTSISVGMEHLVLLETLIFQSCRKLDISEKGGIEDGMPWKALTRLRTLELQHLTNLRHLPSGLQHLTNLRHLKLFCLYDLEEVPEWIGCLSTLESMELECCTKLRSLPEEMRKLTNLNQLQISRCNSLTCLPEEIGQLPSLNALEIVACVGLTKRCRGPNGADWSFIRHIPFLTVQDSLF